MYILLLSLVLYDICDCFAGQRKHLKLCQSMSSNLSVPSEWSNTCQPAGVLFLYSTVRHRREMLIGTLGSFGAPSPHRFSHGIPRTVT